MEPSKNACVQEKKKKSLWKKTFGFLIKKKKDSNQLSSINNSVLSAEQVKNNCSTTPLLAKDTTNKLLKHSSRKKFFLANHESKKTEALKESRKSVQKIPSVHLKKEILTENEILSASANKKFSSKTLELQSSNTKTAIKQAFSCKKIKLPIDKSPSISSWSKSYSLSRPTSTTVSPDLSKLSSSLKINSSSHSEQTLFSETVKFSPILKTAKCSSKPFQLFPTNQKFNQPTKLPHHNNQQVLTKEVENKLQLVTPNPNSNVSFKYEFIYIYIIGIYTYIHKINI